MAEQPALDAAQLLAALDRHQVDCVLIGGMAASSFRDRPEAKRRQDLDDIAVLERLRAELDAAAPAKPTRGARDTGESP